MLIEYACYVIIIFVLSAVTITFTLMPQNCNQFTVSHGEFCLADCMAK